MPTARERQVCSKQQQPDAASVGINVSGEPRLELHSIAQRAHSTADRIPAHGDQCSEQRGDIYYDISGDFSSRQLEVDNNNNSSSGDNRLCSATTQCSFCRWRHHHQPTHDRSVTAVKSAAHQSIESRSMDSEDQWCGRLIRDQHGVYGKLTPVFREHFSNRRKTSVDQQTATAAILSDSDARDVAMETSVMEGVGASANEQQRNMILAAQLSGLSLAERRLAVAPRITLTSFDGDCSSSSNDEGSPRQQRGNGAGSADAGPCLSAGLDSARSHNDSPLSPNFLAVPQLQEVGKERRPAPMVV